MFLTQKKFFKKSICLILMLSLLLQSFPQPVQAGTLDAIKTWIEAKLGQFISRFKLPNELLYSDEKLLKDVDLKLLSGEDNVIPPIPLGAILVPILEFLFETAYIADEILFGNMFDFDELNNKMLKNPFSSEGNMGGTDQAATVDATGVPLVPYLGIPSACELSILPPPEENANFLTPEQRLILHNSCYDLLKLKKAAASQAYSAKQIFNKTDPFSECSILNHCKSSCSIGFGHYAYVINAFEIAKMVLPAGWMETIAKIAKIVQFIQKIKSYYDYYKFITEELAQFISNLSNAIAAIRALAATLNKFLKLNDTESFTKMLSHYGKNLMNLAQAKGDALILATQTQKDGEELIKAMEAEPGVKFLFPQEEQTEDEDAKDEKKRQDLQAIIDDYLLAGFETPLQIFGKLENNGNFLNDHLDPNNNPKKTAPTFDPFGEELEDTGLLCTDGGVAMDKDGNATTSPAGTAFCKFQGSSCPNANWKPYLSWTTTQATTGHKGSGTGCKCEWAKEAEKKGSCQSAYCTESCGGYQERCGQDIGCNDCCLGADITPNHHNWLNIPVEKCEIKCQYARDGSGCEDLYLWRDHSASITAIGCIPTGIVPQIKGICYSPKTPPTPDWFAKFKDFYFEIKKIDKILKDFSSGINAWIKKCNDCDKLKQRNEESGYNYVARKQQCKTNNNCPPSIPSFATIDFNKATSSRQDFLNAINVLPTKPNDFNENLLEPKFWSTSSITVGCPIDAELAVDENLRYFCKYKVACPPGAESLTDGSGQSFCKFNNACPAGWNPHYSNGKGWTETTKATCIPVRMWLDCKQCTTEEHAWSNENTESCLWNKNPCEDDGYGCCPMNQTNTTCYANVVKIGCVPNDKTYARFIPQQWQLCDYSDDLAFMDWQGARAVIEKETKLDKLFAAIQSFPPTSTSTEQVNKFNEFLIEPFIAHLLGEQNKKLDAIKSQINLAITETQNSGIVGSAAAIHILRDFINNKIPSLQNKFKDIANNAIRIKDIWSAGLSGPVTTLMLMEKYVKDIVATIMESQKMATNIADTEAGFDALQKLGLCLLQNNIKDCIKDLPVPSGGIQMNDNGVIFYQFPGSACPSSWGWVPYLNWSTTQSSITYTGSGTDCECGDDSSEESITGSCISAWCGMECGGVQRGCNNEEIYCDNCCMMAAIQPGQHTWSNNSVETCTVNCKYELDGCSDQTHERKASAQITAIGCVLADPIQLPESAKDILKQVFGDTGSLKKVENFLLDDSDSLKKLIGEYKYTCLTPQCSEEKCLEVPGFLGKIKCFEEANYSPYLRQGMTFKQILFYIEAMIKVVNILPKLDEIKDLVISLDPNRVLEKSFNKQCDPVKCPSNDLSCCFDDLKSSLTDDPLDTFAAEFKDISDRVSEVKCSILDIYDMTRGGVPVDAQGNPTTTPAWIDGVSKFYKFTSSDMGGCGDPACPSGWRPYPNANSYWSETKATLGYKGTISNCGCGYYNTSEKNREGLCEYATCGECEDSCNAFDGCQSIEDDDCCMEAQIMPKQHNWSNMGIETCKIECEYDLSSCSDQTHWRSHSAEVIAIGCVPLPETQAIMNEGRGVFASSTAEVGKRTQGMAKELTDLEVKIDRAKAKPVAPTKAECTECTADITTDCTTTLPLPLACKDIKTPMREILYVYYFILGIKAFSAIADVDIKCCCKTAGASDPKCKKFGGLGAIEGIPCKNITGKKDIIVTTCGLSISFDQLKCVYKQARVFIQLIKCAVKLMIKAVKAVQKETGETETSEGKEVKDSTEGVADTTCDQFKSIGGVKAALDCTSANASAGGSTGGSGTTGTGSGTSGSSGLSGGWKIKEIARCVVSPAYSVHRVNKHIIKQTGPKGGPVCGETDSFFGDVETNFTIVRQTLREIDLRRRNIGIEDLFRITAGKIIPGLENYLEEHGYGVKHPFEKSIDCNNPKPYDIYCRGEEIRDKARLVWAISTAINFATSNCTCGQSFCLFPVCISGLPLTIEAITNPFCYLTYIFRHPLLSAIEKLETEIGKK